MKDIDDVARDIYNDVARWYKGGIWRHEQYMLERKSYLKKNYRILYLTLFSKFIPETLFLKTNIIVWWPEIWKRSMK